MSLPDKAWGMSEKLKEAGELLQAQERGIRTLADNLNSLHWMLAEPKTRMPQSMSGVLERIARSMSFCQIKLWNPDTGEDL